MDIGYYGLRMFNRLPFCPNLFQSHYLNALFSRCDDSFPLREAWGMYTLGYTLFFTAS